MTINALVATDKVIVPVQANYLSLMGMEKLFETIVQVKRWFNPSLSVDGILITMLDKRSNFAKEIVNLIHMTYGGRLRVFESEIPLSVRRWLNAAPKGKASTRTTRTGKRRRHICNLRRRYWSMEKSKSAQKIKLSSYEDIFKPENLSAPPEKFPLSALHPFKDHPFKQYSEEKMAEMVESIKQYGVLMPILVRPLE